MLINNSKKIVIKLGSSTVIDKSGKFKKNWVNSLIKDIKKYKKGKDIVIVSSGAIALGCQRLLPSLQLIYASMTGLRHGKSSVKKFINLVNLLS